MKVAKISLLVETATERLEWLIIHNPTVAGTALSFGAELNSGFERAVGATNNKVTLGATGVIVDGGHVTSGSGGGAATSVSVDVKSTLGLGSQIDGTQDIVALCVRPVSGVSTMTLEAGMTVQMRV